MNKKLRACKIVMLLIITSTSIMIIAESKIDTKEVIINPNTVDFLDQYQNISSNTAKEVFFDTWSAQSFTPNVKILTRVQLFLFKKLIPPENAKMVVSIRESLTGNDLTSRTITADELPPDNNEVWIDFDFEDIAVVPDRIYYLICRSNIDPHPTYSGIYCWSNNYNNPYENGDAWLIYDYGQSWIKLEYEDHPDVDFCFRTYGIFDINNPPNTPAITGENNGNIHTLYEYTIQTTDPDQNDVQYYIDWGDNTNITTDFYESGEQISVSHTWTTAGTYTVKVKAVDEYNAESDWVTLSVTMPCSYKPLPPFLVFLLQRFPTAFLLLQHLKES